MKTSRAEFVDLVEHEHAAARFGAANRLDDVAGQGADVGAPVAADFRLVVRAAQRDALEFSSGGTRDRLTERSFPNTGWTDKTQDRAFPFRIELPHREVFEYAALDFLQSVVILVEHGPRLRDVDGCGPGYLPGQFAQSLDIGAQHRALRTAFTHARESLQLFPDMLQRICRHAGLFDGLFQILDLGCALAVLTEFLLDLAQLLAQHMFALALIEFLAGLVANLLGKFQHLDALAEQTQHFVQTAPEFERFEHFLLFLVLYVEQIGDHIGKQRRRSHCLHDTGQFVGHIGQQVNGFDRLPFELQEARLDFRTGFFNGFNDRHARHQEGPAIQKFEHTKARLPLHDEMMSAFSVDITHDLASRTDPVQVVRSQFIFLRIALQQEADPLLGPRGLLDSSHRGCPADGDRRHDARKKHGIAQRHNGERIIRQRFHCGIRARGLGRARRLAGLARQEHFLS